MGHSLFGWKVVANNFPRRTLSFWLKIGVAKMWEYRSCQAHLTLFNQGFFNLRSAKYCSHSHVLCRFFETKTNELNDVGNIESYLLKSEQCRVEKTTSTFRVPPFLSRLWH